MKSIAFLSLDPQLHHVLHIAPIAFHLSCNKDHKITLYIRPQHRSFIDQIAKYVPRHHCHIIELNPSALAKVKYKIKNKAASMHRICQHHMCLLLQHDAIVVSDYIQDGFINQLKSHGILSIKCVHGAVGQAYGFKDDMKQFDLLLAPGQQFIDRLQLNPALLEVRTEMVGYPKFDITLQQATKKVFDNNNPVILYAPHFKLGMSSLSRWGSYILDFFYHHPQYNLIFAPHVNTNDRLIRKVAKKRYGKASNIIIDLGSLNTIDMTYTKAADLYIGDVSSQVCEYLFQPKPCIFLNSHHVDWKDNPYYSHWELGFVIEDVLDLEEKIPQLLLHNPKSAIQKERFNYYFSVQEEAASIRAARAINTLVTTH